MLALLLEVLALRRRGDGDDERDGSGADARPEVTLPRVPKHT